MKILANLLLLSLALATTLAIADEAKKNAKELTQEELDAHVGRMGDVEQIPEGFQFNEAENILWFADHFSTVEKPVSIYYEFEKTGSYEEGFTDTVYLKILELNEDGTKNAKLDFFTADRKQVVTRDNVTNIRGNPVIGIFMQGDVYEMNRITDGHWRHFQKQIKISLREDAKVEPIKFTFNGKEYNGDKIHFMPYLDDPHRRDYERFSEKYYEFIMAEELPGGIYQIKTVIPDTGKENAEPLVLETLKLVDVKQIES